MTDKELVGNLALEVLINYCQSNNIDTGIDPKQLVLAQTFSSLSL